MPFEFLHKILLRSCPSIHLGRLEASLIAVGAVLCGRRLSIAGAGRALPSGAKAKHRIKKIDRLAGNVHLALERLSLYRSMAQLLIGTRPRPLILVDWSDARHDRSLPLLRASIVVDGCSMTLYEEVHPLHFFENRAARAENRPKSFTFQCKLHAMHCSTKSPERIYDARRESTIKRCRNARI